MNVRTWMPPGQSGATTIRTSPGPRPARLPSRRPSTRKAISLHLPCTCLCNSAVAAWLRLALARNWVNSVSSLRRLLPAPKSGDPDSRHATTHQLAPVGVKFLMQGACGVPAWCAGPAAFQAGHPKAPSPAESAQAPGAQLLDYRWTRGNTRFFAHHSGRRCRLGAQGVNGGAATPVERNLRRAHPPLSVL